jgi:biotin--protein ligase
LIKEPWAPKTSLLVIPGGADLPVCQQLNGQGNKVIREFVSKGGNMLGFCSGGYYGSSRVEFEVGDPMMEVSGPRELKFFPGIARGCAFKGFQYGKESGALATKMAINPEFIQLKDCYHYYNGGAVFVDAEQYKNVTVLASYGDQVHVDSGKGQAAVIHCSVGQGDVILTGTHPEFVPQLMHGSQERSYLDVVKQLTAHDEARKKFLRACLLKLGLKVNDDEIVRPRLTPMVLCSPIDGTVQKIINSLVDEIGLKDGLFHCEHDTFHLHQDGTEDMSHIDKQEQLEDPDTAVKEIIAFASSLPDRKLTSYFDIPAYFRYLHQRYGSLDSIRAGSILLYGEVVTSTSVMPNENLSLLRQLPSGLVLAANVQVSGRGRGGNLWINPYGVLASSLILELPISYQHAPVVFIQYLTALAVVEAVKSIGPGYQDIPVKIKWPNDIYVLKPEYFGENLTHNDVEPAWVKICGILVNTNVIDGNYKCIVGTGINLSNSAPTTSVNSTITEWNKFKGTKLDHISSELMLAAYLYQMDVLFNKFKQFGFRSLLPLYYQDWLHGDQIVRLKDHGLIRAKIVGITDDFGLLIAEEVDMNDRPTGQRYHLQPDGNSFDMFNNLISKKST